MLFLAYDEASGSWNPESRSLAGVCSESQGQRAVLPLSLRSSPEAAVSAAYSNDQQDIAETMKRTFGSRLRGLRTLTGMTQAELGGEIGCSAKTISDLERGIGRTAPDLDQVKRYIDACIDQLDITQVARTEERRSLLEDHSLLERLDDYRRDARRRSTGSKRSQGADSAPRAEPSSIRNEPSDADHCLGAHHALARDIAPRELLGRAEERAALLRFCTEDTGPNPEDRYQLWRGLPWAGKTALASSLVANPPDGVRVAAFFANAQQAGQVDCTAFTDVMLEQLAAIAGEPAPETVSQEGRDRERRLLLDLAAARAAERGEMLLLVVDGLDEDVDAFPGSGRPSIASLLPPGPAANVRVLVTSRQYPDLPLDVPDGHPLRRVAERMLAPSPFAAGVERNAKRELLGELGSGDPAQVSVIGFIVASGGGLTLDDLQVLAAIPKVALARMLQQRFSRVLVALRSTSTGGTSYFFAHKTLREAATEYLSPDIPSYRQQLAKWAESYSAHGWPPITPPYLLRPYGRLLLGAADPPALAKMGKDVARYDRMLAASGADHDALTELTEIRRQLATDGRDADFADLACIALVQDMLRDRNQHIPVGLPALLARVGEVAQAEALAQSITDLKDRGQALAALIEVSIKENPSRASEQYGLLENLLTEIGSREAEDIVEQLIGTLISAGHTKFAERVARRFPAQPYRDTRAVSLAQIAIARADTDPADAVRLLDEAEQIAENSRRPGILCDVALIEVKIDRERAMRLLEAAEEAALALDEIVTSDSFHDRRIYYPRANALKKLAETMSDAGEVDGAERIAGLLASDSSHREVLARIARSLNHTDHGAALVMARRFARTIGDGPDALIWLVTLLRDLGDIDGARTIANQLIGVPEPCDDTLKGWRAIELGNALIGLDTPHALQCAARAESDAFNFSKDLPLFYEGLPGPRASDTRLAAAAALWTDLGDLDRALPLADHIEDAGLRVSCLVKIATVGDSAVLAAVCQQLQRLHDYEWHYGDYREGRNSPATSIVKLSAVLASQRRFADAEYLMRCCAELFAKRNGDAAMLNGLLRIADVAADTEPDLAMRLADEIARRARITGRPMWQTQTLNILIDQTIATGDLGLARLLAQTIPDANARAAAQINIAAAHLNNGQNDEAAQLMKPFAATLARPAATLLSPYGEASNLSANEYETMTRIFSALGWESAVTAARERYAHHSSNWSVARKSNEAQWAQLVAANAGTLIKRGDFAEAARLGIELVRKKPSHLAEAASVIRSLICSGAREQVSEIIESAVEPYAQASLLMAMADSLASASDLAGAELAAGTITSAPEACAAFAALTAVAGTNAPEEANRFIARALNELDRIDSQWTRITAAFPLIRAVGRLDPDLALRIERQAEVLISALPTPWQQERQLMLLSEALLDAGLPDEAEIVASKIPDATHRWRQHFTLAIRGRDPSRISRLTAKLASSYINQVGLDDSTDHVLQQFARGREMDDLLDLASTVLADCGEIIRARDVTLAISDDALRSLSLARCAKTAAPFQITQALSLAGQACELATHRNDAYDRRARTASKVAQILFATGDATLASISRQLLATSLTLPGWMEALPSLAQIDADAFTSLGTFAVTIIADPASSRTG